MTVQQTAVAEVIAWRPPDGREWTTEAVEVEVFRRGAPVKLVGPVLKHLERRGWAFYGDAGWALSYAGVRELRA